MSVVVTVPARPTSSDTGLRRHPWNTDFVWIDASGPFRTLSTEQVRHFDDAGFVVLDEVLDAGTVAAVCRETDYFDAESDAALRRAEGERVLISEHGAITFSKHLVTRSERLRQLARDPRLAGIAADLVGPDVRLYWDQAVYKKPEKPRRFPWHQDNGYAYVAPQQYLTVWLALTDATVDNGCPWVAPGVHRTGTLEHRFVAPLGFECLAEVPDAVPAEVPAGGAVVFSSLTPHLTGPNTTGADRKAYIVQYAPSGAEVWRGDPTAGPPTSREPCDDPHRQFVVVRDGQLV